MGKMQSDKKRLRTKLVYSIVCVVLCLAMLLFAVFTYTWFVESHSVSSDQLGYSASGYTRVLVSRTLDSFEDMAQDDRLDVAVRNIYYQQDDIIYPGASGSFDCYIKVDPADSSVSSYNISLDCLIKASETVMSDGVPVETISDISDPNGVFSQYIGTHISFFLGRTQSGDVTTYSDWVDPQSGVNITYTPDEPQHLTIYWVWLETFKEASSYPQILAHMKAHPENWFANDVSPGSDYDPADTQKVSELSGAYNYADTFTGLNLTDSTDDDTDSRVCFELSFSVI